MHAALILLHINTTKEVDSEELYEIDFKYEVIDLFAANCYMSLICSSGAG